MFPSLRSSCTLLLLIALALTFQGVLATSASAQVQTGTPPYGSFGGGPDIINLANLNSHISVPVLHKSGRGTDFTYDLSYDSSVWYPVTSGSTTTWQPVYNFGWAGQTEIAVGYITYAVSNRHCTTDTNQQEYYNVFLGFDYHDPYGRSTWFGGTVWDGTAQDCKLPPPWPTTATLVATDGSGYTLNVDGTTGPTATVTSRTGQIFAPPLQVGSGSGTFTDRNGNKITVNSSGQFYDTLSSTTPVLTVSGSGTVASPLKFTYNAPAGSTFYQVNYTNYTVATNFGVSGISEYKSSAAVPLVTSVVLPDGSQYAFQYETTPGTCSPYSGTTCTTARPTSVTLPTGGRITYSNTFTGCTTGNNGIFSDGSASCLQRSTPDGTWTYTRSQVSGSHWQTLVSDATTPTANQTLIDFQKDGGITFNYFETQRHVYQGSTGGTLLQTINTCYNAAASPCTDTTVTSPFTQRTVIDIPPGGGNLQAQHTEIYDSHGDVTETDDYDWGSGAVGALLKKTAITYASLTNIVSFPQQITVTNGGGTVVSQTKLNYGDSVTATSGTPQHTTPPGSRGNVLSVNLYTQGTTYLTQSTTYFDTGNAQTATDVNGAATTFNYSNSTATCGNSFPTSVSEPLSLSRSMTWNCTGGVQLTSVDENIQTTTTTYNDQYFWRANGITDQALNTTNIAYLTGGVAIQPYFYLNNNNSIVAVAHNFDGLGRPSFDQQYQSPSAQTFDTVSYTYDSNGRPYYTSMPCSVGAGSNCPSTTPKTTQTYDALNRPLLTTDGGGGTVSYSYSQNDVLVTVGR